MVDKISGNLPPLNRPKPAGKSKSGNFKKIMDSSSPSAKTEESGKTTRSDRVVNSGDKPVKGGRVAGARQAFFYPRPESREEKILRIKQAIDAGTYKISSGDVADKMLKIFRDPELVRLFAAKDESKLRKAESKILPHLTKEQKKHYLSVVKKIDGQIDLDSEDMKFIRDIKRLVSQLS